MLYTNMEHSLLNELMRTPISSNELLEKVPNCNVIQYPELAQYNTIDDILEPHGAVVILYLTKRNYGHWVCLFKIGHRTDPRAPLQFFDSYGLYPDDELKFAPTYFRAVNNMMYPHLTYLMSRYKGPIEYNEYQYQKKEPGIATCGRHCIVRLWARRLDNAQYHSFIEDTYIDPDELVTIMTA